ncbi:transcriptional regulator, GntR family [Bifidobacterium margollesii]|uniref:Transcriptional regulator, GntR family n=1 Tax=Bifidobacterium margollesii TaxID=2020964 RepID=A0A2N5JA01_9BIFI|nr:GntR family transcriptional regulator [Bifidobacterium margollesii]PLS31039.1 transcriptional regulator, GntR family [Bifidobacterium margollesii]
MSESKRDLAYNYLRKQIVFCELRPGDLIDEKQITEQLGFSRTPVREAINKLAEEDMLRIFPRKGIVVSQISLKNLQDMIESRLLIEPYLIHQAFPSLDRDSLLHFREALQRTGTDSGDMKDSIEDDFDFKFHMYFAQKANNKYLENLMSTLLALSQRTRVFLPWSSERISESLEEHLNIIDCAMKGDEEGTVQAVRQHLQHSREGYLHVFQSHNDFFV